MIIKADWPAPANVHAFCSTRQGGVSEAPFDSLNLAVHVGDKPEAVAQNRHLLKNLADLPKEPYWLNQTHSTLVQDLPLKNSALKEADAAFTQEKNTVCAVLTADCLPILICNKQGTQIAAVHAGWKGLLAGVLENTCKFFSKPEDLLVWLGPAISAKAYEVGAEFKEAFLKQGFLDEAFVYRNGHYYADMYALAKLACQKIGIEKLYGGNFCTYEQSELFYSYRRDKTCGRMASVIYFT